MTTSTNPFSTKLLLVLIGANLLLGCKEKDERFELLSPAETGVDFINEIEENEQYNMVDYYYMYNGGGVGIGDINNDQLPDLYFTGNMVPDRLYLNQGNLKFIDITETSGVKHNGWSSGVTMTDMNGDDLLDIYVCRSGNENPENRRNLLYINQGAGKFIEQGMKWGVADPGYSTQAAFFDYDRDGDLDLFVLNNTNESKTPSQPRPIIDDGSGLANDRLYQRQGDSFVDVSLEAGITYDGMSLGLAVGDLNEDGWMDICVANDFVAHDFVYINNMDGTFSESSGKYFKHVSHFGMGNDLADINNDGFNDLITLDMLPPDNFHRKKMTGPMNTQLFEYTVSLGIQPQYMRNTLQLNRGTENREGGMVFEEIGQLAGIEATDWSWCPLIADFDNDGWKDIYITNGYLRDITDLDHINYNSTQIKGRSRAEMEAVIKKNAKRRPSIEVANFMYQNQADLTFKSVGDLWGLPEKGLSNGASYADLDNDGDLDLVVSNINSPAFIYENRSSGQANANYLKLILEGDVLNRDAIGSTVKLYSGTSLQTRRQMPTRGFQSSVSALVHFGLGKMTSVDSMIIEWPDGTVEKRNMIIANQTLKVVKGQGLERKSTPIVETWFTEKMLALDHQYQHEDPYYNDFLRQFLIPHKFSQQGPGIAVADIDGDGLDDFFVGGGYKSSGQFFIQKRDATFQTKMLEPDSMKHYEDLGSLFFDADGDGDKDLYLVSGSNEHFADSEYYRDRLYLNNGSGIFAYAENALPEINTSGSCVKAADFDADGDLDLFVGGRLVPLQYPRPGRSTLLINEGGSFRDGTDEFSPDLENVGMVTDALWTDFNGDNQLDLIVVGEFMPITFFRNEQGQLIRLTGNTSAQNTSGWWNSINAGDFDNDGDMDYVIGNLGLNTSYRVSPEEPLTVYAGDFDKNGYLDAILANYLGGREYPVHTRDDLLSQLRSWKSRFTSYGDYAQSTIQDILGTIENEELTKQSVHFFQSAFLENRDGYFDLKPLPIFAQKGPVSGIAIEDINEDGYLDLILAGNSFATEVMIGQYDAMNIELFFGDGQGSFKSVGIMESGLYAPNDNKALAAIEIGGSLSYILTANKGPLYSFQQQPGKRKILEIDDEVWKLEWTLDSGARRIQEVYYGSSYLAQSSRKVAIPTSATELFVTDFQGERREVQL